MYKEDFIVVPKKRYFNIQMNLTDFDHALSLCEEYFHSGGNYNIFFLNAHCFNIAQKDPGYFVSVNKSDLLLNDGIGIKLGSYFTDAKVVENMNGTDFIPKVIELAYKSSQNIYLLGGKEGIASLAKEKLSHKYPGISIVGTRNGFFDFENDQDIVDDILQKKTDLLIVGMGVPRQEMWLTKNKTNLKNVKISIAGGAILDFLSENVYRAPAWMRKIGAEWVFRLLQEPTRLFNRYFIGIPVFFYNIFKIRSSEKGLHKFNFRSR